MSEDFKELALASDAPVEIEEIPRVPVLVVDADPASLDFVTRTLAQSGCDPQAFSDLDPSGGALARLSTDPPIAIALLDARALDPLGGAPELGELRRRSPMRHALQVLVHGDALDIGRVLPKPLERHTLLLAVQEAKRRHDAVAARPASGVAEPARRRSPTPRREPPAELKILQWLRDVDEQRLRSLSGVLEPDATWNMLAELLRARIMKRRLSVTSLCLASRAPVTTALRRIERLLADGLVTYSLDPKDRRRKYVELTVDGAARVQGAVRALAPQAPNGGSAPT